ncbi:MAG: hypothetical protein ABSH32_01485 [Bryobacteraceae bacterium]|jgi:hypothetical protein
MRPELDHAVQRLRNLWQNIDAMERQRIADAKCDVLTEFGRYFHPETLHVLTKEQFRHFLHIKHNRHWRSLERTRLVVSDHIGKLRNALSLLVDENKSIKERFDRLMPHDRPGQIRYLNRGVLTPILQVAYPDKYGVWNTISEHGMKAVSAWPTIPLKASSGDRYYQINENLQYLARELGIDLWTLDVLWTKKALYP